MVNDKVPREGVDIVRTGEKPSQAGRQEPDYVKLEPPAILLNPRDATRSSK